MTTTLETMLDLAEPAIRKVIGRRLGAHPELAEDAAQQVRLHLTEKFSRVLAGGASAIDSVPDYAARAAYNVVHDQFRARDTTRHRLKNRLRYLVDEHPKLGVWKGPSPDLVCGYARWQASRRPLASEPLARLVTGREHLPEDAYPGLAWDAMDAQHWSTLLGALFDHVDGPTELNQLVTAVATLLGIELGGLVQDDATATDADGSGHTRTWGPGASPPPDPATRLHLKEQLTILWTCLQALPRPWMLAVILNPPGTRKSDRGDFAVLVSQGIVTKDDVQSLLSLSSEDYTTLAAPSDDPTEHPDPPGFDGLWRRLPVPDVAIGKILGKTHMQVIGLRRLAVRRLARCRAETLDT